ncbi:uncharacterized protein [Oscarella lobularis]|uniref:uncharacterized protein isoform X3 n=1 Tax=Oscarella lobularis TaxID=121494 RepID=UPI0033137D27
MAYCPISVIHIPEFSTHVACIQLSRGGIRRIPPRGYRLKLCKTFERFQSCAYGRRCVYAHGDDEHARWSVIEERRQKTQLVPELLSQRLREAFLRENYFVLSSTQGRDALDVVWDPCERWTFIDASKEPPFSFLFNCEINCEITFKKEKVKTVSTHFTYCNLSDVRPLPCRYDLSH